MFMATMNSTNPYGMKVIGQMDEIVGTLWTVEGNELVLYYYYRDAYNNYSCDRLEELSLMLTCKGGSANDAFSYMKQVSNKKKPSYKVYMTRDCFNAIEEQYMLESVT